MKRNKFYKTSCYGSVGSNVSFHATNGKGYVTDVDSAHIFTREEAQEEIDRGWLRQGNSEEVFLSVVHIDELTVWKVDCQFVMLFYPINKDPNNEYVVYKKRHWDGNDLAFASAFSYSYDYSKARIFTEQELNEVDLAKWVIVPKFHTDEIARRTFQYGNIDHHKIISSAGIVGRRKKATIRV